MEQDDIDQLAASQYGPPLSPLGGNKGKRRARKPSKAKAEAEPKRRKTAPPTAAEASTAAEPSRKASAESSTARTASGTVKRRSTTKATSTRRKRSGASGSGEKLDVDVDTFVSAFDQAATDAPHARPRSGPVDEPRAPTSSIQQPAMHEYFPPTKPGAPKPSSGPSRSQRPLSAKEQAEVDELTRLYINDDLCLDDDLTERTSAPTPRPFKASPVSSNPGPFLPSSSSPRKTRSPDRPSLAPPPKSSSGSSRPASQTWPEPERTALLSAVDSYVSQMERRLVLAVNEKEAWKRRALQAESRLRPDPI